MDLSVVPYTGSREVVGGEAERGGGGGRYRECLRNHAAALGGQAYDGCGEFMPGGEDGSFEALKCAACGCHRNFHRREGGHSAVRPLVVYNPAAAAAAWDRKKLVHSPTPATTPPGYPSFLPAPAVPLPFHAIQPPPVSSAPPMAYGEVDRSRMGSETPPRREEELSRPSSAEFGVRKRFRTKFTAEQKEKMQAFAEKLGWRIQKHDDAALQEFCGEIGVKRHVLKVWMHNNKHHFSSSPSSATAPTAASSDTADDGPSREASTTPPPIRV